MGCETSGKGVYLTTMSSCHRKGDQNSLTLQVGHVTRSYGTAATAGWKGLPDAAGAVAGRRLPCAGGALVDDDGGLSAARSWGLAVPT